MTGARQILMRGLATGVLAALLGAGIFLAYVSWYTGTDRILPGVKVGRVPVGGLRLEQARARLTDSDFWRKPVLAGAAGPIGETARVTHGEKQWQLPLVTERPDPKGLLERAGAIGRNGTVWVRSQTFLVGLIHGHYIPVEPADLREQTLAAQLSEIAAAVKQGPRDARYDFETDTLTEESPGRQVDLEASLQALRKAIAAGQPEAELVVTPVEPAVRTGDLVHARQHQVAHFTTRILSADAGRVQNISMAVQRISGLVIKPGQEFSFNDVVGPRDAAHGWAQAAEIYQGEYVMGYGGGICQVSSTLYNTILLGGLEVRERYHHDRPLQYIHPGRDATVAWDVLDFRFRNNQEVPVMLGARILPGSPQQIEVSLYSPRPAPTGQIRLEEADVKYFPPKMEEILDPMLPGDYREVIDEGHSGIEVKLYRVFQEGDKERPELVSHDRYLPKNGKVRVGVGNAPGSERLLQPGLN